METSDSTTNTLPINSEALAQFQANFGGSIIGKHDSQYSTERQLWNKMIDKKPGLIAQCTGVHDVIQAVNFARDNNLLTAVRGGGQM